MAESESVQFFQFDQDGNMFIFAPGAGCTGDAKLVKPGDDMIFNSSVSFYEDTTNIVCGSMVQSICDSSLQCMSPSCSSQRSFHEPLKREVLEELSHKKFAPETMKKINWVVKMFKEWRFNRNQSGGCEVITCNLDEKQTITVDSVVYALTRFITEIKKIDGNEYPSKTLYEIVVSFQFYLETLGFGWKLLNQEKFQEVKFTLDNIMKMRTEQGIGGKVRQAEILTSNHEEYLWLLNLLGTSNPDQLLSTIIFIVGKGFALRAGKEHQVLRSPLFDSQFEFLQDEEAQWFIRYKEDFGLKTNKGGLKHRKIDTKQVDLYPIEDETKCPFRIFMFYLSKLPKDRKCPSFYLQPKKKFTPDEWYLDRPVRVNRLRDNVKDLCSKAGFPGFFSNHSLRSTAATHMYRCNIDEQLIMEITGHHSLAVRSYKRTSQSQCKAASNCMFSK